eukprot:5066240-Alexandrium_andersonii.AAC.1
MSASLVGSEMCIRDRHSPPRQVSLALVCQVAPSDHSPVHAVCRVVAVSYTHLTLPTICSV